MGILNRIFGSTESVATTAEYDDEVHLKIWNEYKKTIAEKEQIIRKLPTLFGQKKDAIQKLQQFLDLDLVYIHTGEQKEDDLVKNILALEHSKKIKRVQLLESRLAYAETKYRYAYELLRHIYSTLKSEAKALKKLTTATDVRKYRKLTELLQSELVIEKMLCEKIEERESISKLIIDLVKGEHNIKILNSKEKRIIKSFQKGSPASGITNKWINAIFEGMTDAIHELIAEGAIDSHPDADSEFVNRPEFVDFARKTIKNLRRKPVSEETINAFVYLFREKYTYERD